MLLYTDTEGLVHYYEYADIYSDHTRCYHHISYIRLFQHNQCAYP